MPAKKPVSLVIDTNVLLSALIGGQLRWFRDVLDDDRFEFLISSRMTEELESVVVRPRLQRYFSVEEAAELMDLIQRNALAIDIGPPYEAICRDPKDDYLLALAKAGKAQLLVTGDADLLVLKKYGKTIIIKPADFRKKYL
jgi:putative PIN family toxin of toxin-antitoxin system